MKSNYLSEKYELEDKIIKYYPKTIARTKETIAGLEKDISLAKEHPKPLDDTFVGIEVKGVSYSEKAEGGQKIIDACKEMTSPDPSLSASTEALIWSFPLIPLRKPIR